MPNDQREAVARIVEIAVVRHGVEETALEGTLWDADAILALIRPAPVALGGQHSTPTDFPPDDVLACVEDTTPARAEAQDEGAAGERGKSRGQVAYEGWAQGLPGCEWANQTRTQQRAWEKAAQAVIDAHPSPTPAADADRVRIAVEAIQAEINAPLTGPTHGAWDRGRIAGLKEALAALKSTAAKEGGE